MNKRPSWAAYRSFMSVRLIGLDKHPGVQPVEVRETWQIMVVKCVLKVTCQEVKEDCMTDQLCILVEAGIEGVIHVMHLPWQHHSQEYDLGFLLIDAQNAFNE